jgi:hypothetical protein
MKKRTLYQLGEYRITEYEKQVLWWETHHGLGEQRSGKCFIHDDILILGFSRHEDIGFLKLEFLAKLQKLPPWKKTRYYCFASELLDVASGRTVSEGLLERILSLGGMKTSCAKPVTAEGPGTFRLDKYQITVAADGQISWQADGGMNKLVGGQCVIESGVFFVGRQEHAKGEQSKREFLTRLQELPKWDRTTIWSHTPALRACEPRVQKYRPHTTSPQQNMREDIACPEKRTSTYKYESRKRLSDLLPSGLKLRTLSMPLLHKPLGHGFRKPSWRLVHGANLSLIWIISLVLAGLLLGLTLGLKGVEKGVHWFQSSEGHDHKHKAQRR